MTRYADGTYDDWELNEARSDLKTYQRTDAKLQEYRKRYRQEFDARVKAGLNSNRSFACMMVVEDEMKARGLIEEGGTE